MSTGGVDLEKVTAFDDIEPSSRVRALLPPEIKDNQITVALSAAAPPLTYVSADGHTSLGINADIARALVRIMGLDAKLVSVPFDQIIPGLVSKRYQWSMASMTPTPDRLKVLDMVTFTRGGSSIVVEQGNPKHLTLKTLCGARVAVGVASIQATSQLPDLNKKVCTPAGRKPIKPFEVPNPNQALITLASGRVDAFLGDGIPLNYATKANPGKFEVLDQDAFNEVAYGETDEASSVSAMAVPKGSTFTPALVAAMKELQSMPDYAAIYDRWGLEEFALSADQVTQVEEAE